VFFVTRMKDNARFEVVEDRPPPQSRNILKDQTIRLTGVGAQDKCPCLLCRVEAVREGHRRGAGVSDQPPPAGRQHDCRDLQGPLTDRTAVQGADAKLHLISDEAQRDER
jgi:hypothetical protein